jgi:hypothetical protein
VVVWSLTQPGPFAIRGTKSADLGIYVLDPQTGEEIPRHKLFSRREGAMPWLKHPMVKANLPKMLVDERN